MGDKSVETLGSQIQFSSVLETFLPLPLQTILIFQFLDKTDHSTYTTLNWGTRGIGKLMLDKNKIEQMLQYRKASFSISVSATFVAHCSYTFSECRWFFTCCSICKKYATSGNLTAFTGYLSLQNKTPRLHPRY